MHFRQKLTFMAFGSILTLAGYLLTTHTSNVTAQDSKTNLEHIVCDSITIHDEQIKIVDENNQSTVINSTGIEIFDGTSPLKIYYETDVDAGMVVLANPKKHIGCLIHPGEISLVKGLSCALSIHPHVIIFEDESGDLRMLIYHEPEGNDINRLSREIGEGKTVRIQIGDREVEVNSVAEGVARSWLEYVTRLIRRPELYVAVVGFTPSAEGSDGETTRFSFDPVVLVASLLGMGLMAGRLNAKQLGVGRTNIYRAIQKLGVKGYSYETIDDLVKRIGKGIVAKRLAAGTGKANIRKSQMGDQYVPSGQAAREKFIPKVGEQRLKEIVNEATKKKKPLSELLRAELGDEEYGEVVAQIQQAQTDIGRAESGIRQASKRPRDFEKQPVKREREVLALQQKLDRLEQTTDYNEAARIIRWITDMAFHLKDNNQGVDFENLLESWIDKSIFKDGKRHRMNEAKLQNIKEEVPLFKWNDPTRSPYGSGPSSDHYATEPHHDPYTTFPAYVDPDSTSPSFAIRDKLEKLLDGYVDDPQLVAVEDPVTKAKWLEETLNLRDPKTGERTSAFTPTNPDSLSEVAKQNKVVNVIIARNIRRKQGPRQVVKVVYGVPVNPALIEGRPASDVAAMESWETRPMGQTVLQPTTYAPRFLSKEEIGYLINEGHVRIERDGDYTITLGTANELYRKMVENIKLGKEENKIQAGRGKGRFLSQAEKDARKADAYRSIIEIENEEALEDNLIVQDYKKLFYHAAQGGQALRVLIPDEIGYREFIRDFADDIKTLVTHHEDPRRLIQMLYEFIEYPAVKAHLQSLRWNRYDFDEDTLTGIEDVYAQSESVEIHPTTGEQIIREPGELIAEGQPGAEDMFLHIRDRYFSLLESGASPEFIKSARQNLIDAGIAYDMLLQRRRLMTNGYAAMHELLSRVSEYRNRVAQDLVEYLPYKYAKRFEVPRELRMLDPDTVDKFGDQPSIYSTVLPSRNISFEHPLARMYNIIQAIGEEGENYTRDVVKNYLMNEYLKSVGDRSIPMDMSIEDLRQYFEEYTLHDYDEVPSYPLELRESGERLEHNPMESVGTGEQAMLGRRGPTHTERVNQALAIQGQSTIGDEEDGLQAAYWDMVHEADLENN